MVVLLNIFGTLLIVIIVLVLVFGFALIKFSKKSTSNQNTQVEDQVRNALQTARRIRFKAQADINRIKQWIIDSINTAYGQYLSRSLDDSNLAEEYNKIKQQYGNKLDPELFERTDRIIQEYLSLIDMKNAEIQTAEKIEQKYQKLLDQLKNLHFRQNQSQRLSIHEQRIQQLKSQTQENTQKVLEQAYSFEDIKHDVNQKIANLQALEQLQLQFSDKPLSNPQSYKQQMEQIISQLD